MSGTSIEMLELQELNSHQIPDKAAIRPVADLAELRRYTNGDVDLDREILDLFCSGTPEHFDRLNSDCSGRRPCTSAEWHLAVHTIKSSAVTIGAWEVAQIAVGLLEMPFDQRTELHCAEVQKLGASLKTVYSHVKRLIETL